MRPSVRKAADMEPHFAAARVLWLLWHGAIQPYVRGMARPTPSCSTHLASLDYPRWRLSRVGGSNHKLFDESADCEYGQTKFERA